MAQFVRRLLNSVGYLDALIMVFLGGAVVFLSPALYLWARESMPWYTPYALWMLIILAAALANLIRARRGV